MRPTHDAGRSISCPTLTSRVEGIADGAAAPESGSVLHVAPEKVVVEQSSSDGFLKLNTSAALRVDPRHDVLDGAVLPGRVHRLEHDQNRVDVVGIEPLLRLRKRFERFFDQEGQIGLRLRSSRLGLLELAGARPAGIMIFQAHPTAGSYAKQPLGITFFERPSPSDALPSVIRAAYPVDPISVSDIPPRRRTKRPGYAAGAGRPRRPRRARGGP